MLEPLFAVAAILVRANSRPEQVQQSFLDHLIG
jgi:hypothetical protein